MGPYADAAANSARSCLAALTTFVKAGTTSAYFLVFSPQSGFTHSTFKSSTASICRQGTRATNW